MSSLSKPFPADLRLLTALRAFAALLVVMFHFAARSAPGSVLHTTLVDHGQLGVDIFFVLSGFILAHVYLARCQQGRFSARDFLINRFARLYPMHLLMLLAACASGWFAMMNGRPLEIYGPQMGLDPATGHGILWNLLANLSLTHAWGTTNSHYFNSVSWSISAETAAYLLFPLIAAASLAFGDKAKQRLIAALLFYAACEISARFVLGNSLNDLSWHFGIFRIVPEFMLGVAFYGLGVARPLSREKLVWMAPAGLFLGVALLALGAPAFLMPPVFGGVILLLASAEREGLTPPARILDGLVYLGEISYSTYMLHLIFGKIYFNTLARIAGYDPQALPVGQILLALVPVLLVSAVTYHLVELPGRKLLRDWLHRPFGKTRAAVAAH